MSEKEKKIMIIQVVSGLSYQCLCLQLLLFASQWILLVQSEAGLEKGLSQKNPATSSSSANDLSDIKWTQEDEVAVNKMLNYFNRPMSYALNRLTDKIEKKLSPFKFGKRSLLEKRDMRKSIRGFFNKNYHKPTIKSFKPILKSKIQTVIKYQQDTLAKRDLSEEQRKEKAKKVAQVFTKDVQRSFQDHSMNKFKNWRKELSQRLKK